MRIAYQGEPGAYSEQAILEYFAQQAEPVAKPTFAEVFQAVCGGETEGGLVPVCNSLAGPVTEVWNLLQTADVLVTGEIALPIHHCLLCLPGQSIYDIRRVISHPQALAQCSVYLASMQANGVEVAQEYDTAGSAKLIREQEMYGVAAVASSRAADLYQLSVLAREIENNPRGNTTQFLALQRELAGSSLCSGDGVPVALAALNHHTPGSHSPAVRG